MIESVEKIYRSWVLVAGGVFAGVMDAESRERAREKFLEGSGDEFEGLEVDVVTSDEFYAKGYSVR